MPPTSLAPVRFCFRHPCRVLGLGLLFASTALVHAQTTLLSENFTGAAVGTTTNNTKAVFGSGTGGNTTNTWRSTNDAGISAVTLPSDTTTGPNEGSADKAMQVVSTSNGTGYIAKFTSTTLAVGKTLTLTFDCRFVTLPSASSSGVRFGLYNSRGTDYTVGTADTYDNDDSGYRIFSAANTTTTGILYRENGGNGSAGGGSAGAIGTSGLPDAESLDSAVVNFNQGTTTANYSFSITRVNTTTVSFGLSINGSNKLSTADSDSNVSAIFQFDEVLIGTGIASTFAFDNVSVLLSTASIPEPSTYALLFSGLAGAAVIGFRRKRR